MNKISFTRKIILLLVICMAFFMSSLVFAADRYRVSAQFFHLGELIGAPTLDVEEGETAAGEYSVDGSGHYKIVVLVRPAIDGQVSVSLQYTSGKLNVQPNLMVEIGQPTSATIKKVRLNLLVEKIEEEKLETPDSSLESVTQSTR